MQGCLCLSHCIYGHRFMQTAPSFSLHYFLIWLVVKKELEWDEQ